MVEKLRLNGYHTPKLFDAYHNIPRDRDEVITSIDQNGNLKLGASVFRRDETGELAISQTGTVDTSHYDWTAKLATFTRDQVIEGMLRFNGLLKDGVPEERRERTRKIYERIFDEEVKKIQEEKRIEKNSYF